MTRFGSWDTTRVWNSSLLRVCELPSFAAYVLNWATRTLMADSMLKWNGSFTLDKAFVTNPRVTDYWHN